MKRFSVILISVSIIVSIMVYLIKSNIELKRLLNNTMINLKAYVAENSSIKKDNRVFLLTVKLLNYYNDSIINKMRSVLKLLSIKDKLVASLLYLLSCNSKADTIVFRDTIFHNSFKRIDTLFGDKWYKCKLVLLYPSTIEISPAFISEKYIITFDKKETVYPPKKFFLLRWFLKKLLVRIVEVYEKSPYILTKLQRFIEIIK